jgi:hypothetical protein
MSVRVPLESPVAGPPPCVAEPTHRLLNAVAGYAIALLSGPGLFSKHHSASLLTPTSQADAESLSPLQNPRNRLAGWIVMDN